MIEKMRPCSPSSITIDRAMPIMVNAKMLHCIFYACAFLENIIFIIIKNKAIVREPRSKCNSRYLLKKRQSWLNPVNKILDAHWNIFALIGASCWGFRYHREEIYMSSVRLLVSFYKFCGVVTSQPTPVLEVMMPGSHDREFRCLHALISTTFMISKPSAKLVTNEGRALSNSIVSSSIHLISRIARNITMEEIK